MATKRKPKPKPTATPKAVVCRHERTRPETKIPGITVCVECGARLVR